MIASGYSLVISCDTDPDECAAPREERRWVTDGGGGGRFQIGMFDREYFHELKAVCWRVARKAGWKFTRSGHTFCKWCVAAGKVSLPPEPTLERASEPEGAESPGRTRTARKTHPRAT